MSTDKKAGYALRLEVDYPEKSDRLTTFFRLLWGIPIGIILGLVSGAGETVTNTTILNEAGEIISTASKTAGGMAMGLTSAVALMIIFRQKYPKWWFNFSRELLHFETKVGAYMFLLTDQYPSTDEEQSVHLEIDFPDVKADLNRYLPLVKWFLAIPHYFVLFFLGIGAVFATIIAWFSIMFTGKYSQEIFGYIVGVNRWVLRVTAYAFLLVTDEYPPFSLD
jgi:hypothetical protein